MKSFDQATGKRLGELKALKYVDLIGIHISMEPPEIEGYSVLRKNR